VSAAAFQAALARLVVDPAYREGVRAHGEPVLEGLDALERRRLLAVAAGPGLDMTCKVHQAWRLGKLYTMVPLTCALLGEESLKRAVHDFWRSRPPRSFYFRDEAIDFCDHLSTRSEIPYLAEVLAYERAVLELRRPFTGDERERTATVEFRHDPARLLSALRAGERPGAIPELPCRLIGSARQGGPIAWRLVSAGGNRGFGPMVGRSQIHP
jgi:hypothetical protein